MMEVLKAIIAIVFVLSVFAMGGSFIYQGICLVTHVKWMPMIQNIALLAWIASFVLAQLFIK